VGVRVGKALSLSGRGTFVGARKIGMKQTCAAKKLRNLQKLRCAGILTCAAQEDYALRRKPKICMPSPKICVPNPISLAPIVFESFRAFIRTDGQVRNLSVNTVRRSGDQTVRRTCLGPTDIANSTRLVILADGHD